MTDREIIKLERHAQEQGRTIRYLQRRLAEGVHGRLKQARKERGEAINERNAANAEVKLLRAALAEATA